MERRTDGRRGEKGRETYTIIARHADSVEVTLVYAVDVHLLEDGVRGGESCGGEDDRESLHFEVDA
jgi:hypothetical protein